MNNDTVSMVLEYLDKVGGVISKGAEAGFELMVRQQIISSSVSLAFSLLVATVFVIGSKQLLKATREQREEIRGKGYRTSITEDFIHALPVWIMIIGIIMGVILMFTIPSDITHLLNPQYHAVKDIISVLK